VVQLNKVGVVEVIHLMKDINMKYKIVELEEMINNLKKVKKSDKWGLSDQSELDLTTYELLVETHQINEVMNKLSK